MSNTVDTSKEAVERVSAYLAEHDRRAKNGGTFAADHIHTLGMVDDGLELTASDLRILLSDIAQLRREVEEARDKALEDAARAAVIPCYETRHVTLGDKVAAAIHTLKARP